MKPVRPTLVVMPYDVFADYGVFLKILRRFTVVFFYEMFYRRTQTVKHFRTGIYDYGNIIVGTGKIIIVFVVSVFIEIGKYVHYVDSVVKPVSRVIRRIVRARKRNSRRLVCVEIRHVLVFRV